MTLYQRVIWLNISVRLKSLDRPTFERFNIANWRHQLNPILGDPLRSVSIVYLSVGRFRELPKIPSDDTRNNYNDIILLNDCNDIILAAALARYNICITEFEFAAVTSYT